MSTENNVPDKIVSNNPLPQQTAASRLPDRTFLMKRFGVPIPENGPNTPAIATKVTKVP